MTAWQDQPPLSRRQVRQNERGETAEGRVDLAKQSGEQPDFTAIAREGWDTEARRIAAAAPAPNPIQPAAFQSSRRSQRSLQAVEPAAAEPLEYLTQARPQAQSTDGQQLRRRSVSAVGETPADAQSVEQQQGYRVRDFSPEGRPSFSSTTPEVTNEPTVPENLQYRTHGAPPAYVAPVQAQPEPVQPTQSGPVEERTFSRRELRAMEAAKNPSVDAPQLIEPFAQLLSPAALANPVIPTPVEVSPPALVEPAPPEQPLRRDRTRALSNEQDYREADALAEFDALTGGGGDTTPSRLSDQQPAQQQPVEVDPFAELGLTGRTTESTEPSTWTPPTGHWSTQAMIDDDEQIQENTLSRNVGATSGAITTSALVLPSLPADSLTRPLGSTGEILITGTIDLPRSLGSTGAQPGRYDHSDVDALLEAGDREDAPANPDSAPVRAIRAVSTHTSTRGVMEAKKPKGSSRLPIILGVAATVMAVGVVVLVVAAMVFGVFK